MRDSNPPLVKTTEVSPNLPSLVTFEDLATQRKLLQEFCPSHVPSIEFFLSKNKELPIFRLDDQELDPEKFRHITSSATCYESIEQCPDKFRPQTKSTNDFQRLGNKFANEAIDLPVESWISDGAAGIYCSCRGLPFVLSKLDKWHSNIDVHLKRIFYQLDEKPNRFAIGEADKAKDLKDKPKEQLSWYKPNAYHTYWTLEVLRILGEPRFKEGRENSEEMEASLKRRDQLRLWARQQLGIQAALHSAESSMRDSDQLAWSLTILISEPQDYQSNLAEQDLIKQAFGCLFSTQEEVGTWRHYAPLFHYPHAGNAYCYVFETFTALLKHALRAGAEFVRNELRNYFPNLIKLWEYAKSTKTPTHREMLSGYAWSSGHRNRPTLESWATASVFAYAQALRRLTGLWAADGALKTLNYKSSYTTREKAQERLLERADIWSCDDLADRLWSMFINPVPDDNTQEEPDPDTPLIGRAFPCSAIFFGPPGTSKTSLVAAIAGSIGWKYIELHPSHFVAEGLPNVQHTADQIFKRLMQLDHAVVLFDEIDELVRERDIEPDQFGRFLTTSMLPRLAELWKGRKVMYFVATNHIEYFDRAVTRSERFDAIIFMSPPSFDAKKQELLRILRETHHIDAKFDEDVTKTRIEAAMPSTLCAAADTEQKRKELKEKAPPAGNLAKFALLRWDEMNDLALHVEACMGTGRVLNKDILEKALSLIKDGKSRTLAEYCRFISDQRDYERFDASRSARWIIKEIEGSDGSPPPNPVNKCNGTLSVDVPVGSVKNVRVNGYTVELAAEHGKPTRGLIRLKREGDNAGSQRTP